MKNLKAFAFVSTLFCSLLVGAADKPNFIVILTDDQGYADVGFNNSKDIITPHIDRIANEGARFTNGYVTYAVCGPSRAGLLTGRYQERFGFGRNPRIDTKDPTAGLPLEEQMISEVLQPIGYTSGIVGKWHMGTHKRFRPNNRGFDYFYGFLSGGHRYFPEELTIDRIENAKRDWSWYNTKLLENRKTVEIDEYLTDELSHKAIEFIEREKDNPFFLYLAYNAPHTPLQATKPYLDRNKHIKDEKRRTFAAMVTAVDDGVGRILAALEQHNIDDKTLIFFLSDNGGARNKGGDNGELRGFKGQYFEGGIRVPFAMRWPGKIPAGIDYHHPVSSLDILGTIADLTQAPIAAERPLDGVNLLPFLRGEQQGQPHEILYWRAFDRGDLAIRNGNSKAIISEREGNMLFDLEQDVSENNNRLKDNQREFLQHAIEVKKWESEMIDPIFKPLQGFKNRMRKR